MICSNEECCLLVFMTDEEAVVPEIDGSLTSVTRNEDLMDVFDSSGMDKVDKNVDVANDDWCDSVAFADDVSFGHCQPQNDVRQTNMIFFYNKIGNYIHLSDFFYCNKLLPFIEPQKIFPLMDFLYFDRLDTFSTYILH